MNATVVVLGGHFDSLDKVTFFLKILKAGAMPAKEHDSHPPGSNQLKVPSFCEHFLQEMEPLF